MTNAENEKHQIFWPMLFGVCSASMVCIALFITGICMAATGQFNCPLWERLLGYGIIFVMIVFFHRVFDGPHPHVWDHRHQWRVQNVTGIFVLLLVASFVINAWWTTARPVFELFVLGSLSILYNSLESRPLD